MFTGKLRSLSIDTAVVVFLLGVELGRSTSFFSLDVLLLTITLLSVACLPYFLTVEADSFGRWLTGRSLISTAGAAVGLSLADAAYYAPMTLLIVAALISCSIQFYSLFRLRPAD